VETTLSLVADSQLREYRLIPGPLNLEDLPDLKQLVRECRAMRGQGQGDDWPVYLTGAGASPELLDSLRECGLDAELLSLTFGGKMIAPAFVPAVALALRADPRKAEDSFNLRQGPFAYRGELRTAKWTLVAAAGLLILTLLVVGAAAFINYRDRARQAEVLQQELVQMYQTAFPGTTLTVDVALQMESKLRELRGNAETLGISGQPPPWRILRELAELPAHVPIEVEELDCGSEEVLLSGVTDSFEAVNRIRDQLAGSFLFTGVEVAESRKTLDGSQIEFRLRLPRAAKRGTP
jgi:general secretion pathway protein L